MNEQQKQAVMVLVFAVILASAVLAAITIYVDRALPPEPVDPEMLEIHPPAPDDAPYPAPVPEPAPEETARQHDADAQFTGEPEQSDVATDLMARSSQTEILPQVSEDDINLLACAIYQEAGADYVADETRYMVGDVILNRVADSRYPDTLLEVLTEKGQYGEFHWTGVVWPEKAAAEPEAVQRALGVARALLYNTHSMLYARGYVFQAEFPQGQNRIYADGIYFGT